MYARTPDDSAAPEATHALAVQDPGRAWYLGRIQLLRDLCEDVAQMGEQGDELSKTAGDLANLLIGHLRASGDAEWEGYVDLAGGKSPNLAIALRQSGPPISSSMVEYPAEQLKLPTAIWSRQTVESGGLWTCPGDGVSEGFVIDPLFAPQPRPESTDDCLVVPLVDRRHVATAALHEVLEQFLRNALAITEPCESLGAWRRLKYLSQHYRQVYQVGLSELPADELAGWDKSELTNLALSDAAHRINTLASTSMAIRLLALGAVTTALAAWIRQVDALRPEQMQTAPEDRVLGMVKQWASTFDLTLQSLNSALLMERDLNPVEWSTRVIQRPFPGTVPLLQAVRRA
ncbi:hypothetical protein H8Z72_23525 (plasmid) [Xanthomonas citri pv. citri]|uniref:hypothetical protein n=1 Tax=Xanthomonas citri TaxID=346 RepID=UPI0019345307|nr:hypothetical protein [Xanthomonas citri]QRD62714.1 hypothetical protein H8Z74_22660 [Xanthomonas citri pv. citri]QRD67041.1 hypothetical protein H8Z73_22745 [Xanthomonas citri pv. citri]QRD71706.1 hypothetical protein H8Z72_23525 [Xanthomonas citri pv. citri]